MVDRFTTGPDNVVERLNQIIDELDNLRRISGSSYISVNRSSAGATVSLNTNKLREIFPHTQLRRAITTAAAGATATITVNLYDSSGVEQTTGDESGITVYCSISGDTSYSSPLNAAIPLLTDNTDIFVMKLPLYNLGTPESAWFCTQIFQKMDLCPLDA